MDDRFKKAMDAIVPDESMIERIIMSEVALFRQALTMLCWGLILTSFNINVPSIELALYTTWAGNIMLALGLWMLRTENRPLYKAYQLAVAGLIFRLAHFWLGVFPQNAGVMTWLLPLCFVVSLGIILLQLYSLFSGLRDLALRFDNTRLAARLMRGFLLYIMLYAFFLLGMLIPLITILVIPYGLYVLIRLPLTVSKLKQYVPLGKCETTVNALNKRVFGALVLYMVVAVGGVMGCLYYVNAPNPTSRLYSNNPSAETMVIREKLLGFGMPDDVLCDLPDDEVLQYEGIYDATSEYMVSTETTNRDGGKLAIYAFIGIMPEGKVRTLFHYRWLTLPKHHYVDLLSVAMPLNLFAMYPDAKALGLALYDKDGLTYSQTLLNDGDILGQFATGAGQLGFSHSGYLTQIQFRLYPKYENQRGYAAVNMVAAYPSQTMVFNSWATYVHQERLWNRPYFNALNQTAGNGYSHIRNNAFNAEAFWSEGFYTVTDYEPEGYVWPEE